jgi:hypothetical protein
MGARDRLTMNWHSIGLYANAFGIDDAYAIHLSYFGLNRDIFGLGRDLQQIHIREMIVDFQHAINQGAGSDAIMPYLRQYDWRTQEEFNTLVNASNGE